VQTHLTYGSALPGPFASAVHTLLPDSVGSVEITVEELRMLCERNEHMSCRSRFGMSRKRCNLQRLADADPKVKEKKDTKRASCRRRPQQCIHVGHNGYSTNSFATATGVLVHAGMTCVCEAQATVVGLGHSAMTEETPNPVWIHLRFRYHLGTSIRQESVM